MESERLKQFGADDLEQFFALSSDLLAIVKADGSFKRINPAFEHMLGFNTEEVLSKPFIALIHSEDRPAIQAEMARLVVSDPAVQFHSRICCQDGSCKWLEWTVSLAQDSDSQQSLFYCIARDMTGQHQVEQALQDSERRFQAIFNQTFQFIGLLTPDGILLEANETALSFGGFPAEQVLGQPFWETPWWQTSAEARQQLKAAIAQSARGKFIRYEVDVLGAGDQVLTIDFSLKPVFNQAGEVTLLIPEGRDITERKAAEAEIRQLNTELEARVARRTAEIRRYAEAIENMQAGFHLWRLEAPDAPQSFRLLLANPAAEQLLTTPNEQVLGKPIAEALPNIFDTEAPEICRQVVITGRKQSLGDVNYTISSGETLTFAVKLFPLEDQCLGVLFEDVTERRRIQQHLSEQREQLKIIFEKAGVGIARLSLDGRWIQVNEKLCEILGYPREELFSTSFQAITYPDDAAIDQQYYDALMSGEIDTVSFEKRYVRKDGEPIWCNVIPSIIRDERRRPCYFIAFIEDITQRKASALTLERQKNELAQTSLILAQTMTELERRNQELDEFAYVASHDLKAPLRAIANLAAWLEEDLNALLPDENQQQLNLLQGRVHRMENLIDGLLAYSRAGRRNQIIEEVNLNQLLREQIDLLDPPAAFTLDIAPGLPTLAARRVPLIQVFTNLISNAIKHHHRSDGRIEIRCQPHSGGYEFSVTDDGPGIDPAYHSKIFNIFQVLEARDQVENTGIGLAIVKKMVEAQGGEISVESEVGQGATFRFTWPNGPELGSQSLP